MSTWGGSATLIRSLLILGIARSNYKAGTKAAGTKVSADVVPRGLSGGYVGVWTQGILVLTATYLLVGQPCVNKPCTIDKFSKGTHVGQAQVQTGSCGAREVGRSVVARP